MTAAIFGLVGVIVGGTITAWASYFMERRKGWVAARGAGLQLYADLEHANGLDGAESDKAFREVTTTAWSQHRDALLFRAGTFPSGLNAENWLALAKYMTQIERAATSSETDRAKEQARQALDLLEVFRPDRPAPTAMFIQVARRLNPLARRRPAT